MIVDTRVSPHELEKLFDETGVLAVELDEHASSIDLLALVKQHRGYRHWLPLLQLVALHRSADDVLLRYLVRNADDSGVLNAVATSGRASASILRRLARSRHRSVREHAELALLGVELAKAEPPRFRELLEEHRGEDEREVTVRGVLATHPRTPEDVLSELTRDEVDFIRKAVSMRPKK